MKKRNLFLISAILYIIFALLAKQSKAQNIGINSTGATPNNSAMLDVDVSALGTKKGLLIPRITAAQKTAMNPLPAAAQGLMVYQTDGVQGFYYNTSTTTTPAWSYIAPSGVAGWSTLGNAGTVAGTNFIGTTDAIDFVVRTNNVERYRVTASGNIGIGTTTPLEKLHISGGEDILIEDNGSLKGDNGGSSFNLIGWSSSIVGIGQNTSGYGGTVLYTPAASGFGVSIQNPALFGATPIAFFNDDGNVGLGTGTPSEKLHIAGGGDILVEDDGFMKGENGGTSFNMIGWNSSIIRIGQNTSGYGGTVLYTPAASGFGVSIQNPALFGATPIAFFNDDGNVGLGTGTPSEKLHIAGGGDILVEDDGFMKGENGGTSFNMIGWNSSIIRIGQNTSGYGGTVLYTPAASGFGVSIQNPALFGATPIAFFQDNGNVGIGTGTPSEKLDVTGKTKTVELQVTNGAVNGYVLTSDASGNATWQASTPASTTAWSLTGNSGTTAGTNFIGTIDVKDLVFKTTNAERMRILSTGNVGIGTSAPSAKLDVLGTIRTGGPSVDGQLLVYSEQGVTDYTYTINPHAAATQNVTLTLPPNDGNANDVLTSDGAGNLSWAAGTSGWSLTGNTGTSSLTNFIGTTDPTSLVFRTNNTEKARITSGGYIGVGTNAPGSMIHISADAGVMTPQLRIQDTRATGATMNIHAGGGYAAIDMVGNMPFQIGTNSFTRVTVSGNGDVGIGNGLPAEELHVYEWEDSNKHTVFSQADQVSTTTDYQNVAVTGIGSGGNGTWGYGIGVMGLGDQTGSWKAVGVYAGLASTVPSITPASDAALYADASSIGYAGLFMNGNVGIGTTAPAERLEVCGNLKIVGTITAQGAITTNGAITCSSDKRFKKDIQPLNKSLNNVLKLQGTNYFWKVNEFPDRNFTTDKQIGFIAQEVEKVYPELVFTDKEGFKSVDYSRLTPILVEAIKEQQKLIDEQAANMNELRKEISEIRALLLITGTAQK